MKNLLADTFKNEICAKVSLQCGYQLETAINDSLLFHLYEKGHGSGGGGGEEEIRCAFMGPFICSF